MAKQLTVREFFKQFPDDDTCLDHIMEVRYGKRHVCEVCGVESTFHKITDRRAYACPQCGDHLYPCTGTLFEDSRTSLQLWFYAIYLFASTRHGVSAKELERQLGVTYKCAWRMGHEIRKHMEFVDGEPPLSGIVEIDETYVGGRKRGVKAQGRGTKGKTVVFGMLQRNGDVITKVVPNLKRTTLYPFIGDHVEPGTEIHTDEFTIYNALPNSGYKHKRVKHNWGEYVSRDGTTHVNSIEGYWAQLKKSITSTHIHVSGKHLNKYTKEFEYRYNSRKQPEAMISELLTTFPKS